MHICSNQSTFDSLIAIQDAGVYINTHKVHVLIDICGLHANGTLIYGSVRPHIIVHAVRVLIDIRGSLDHLVGGGPEIVCMQYC